MKNKLIVDFFREIARGFGRFISIFFIVMLGTMTIPHLWTLRCLVH